MALCIIFWERARTHTTAVVPVASLTSGAATATATGTVDGFWYFAAHVVLCVLVGAELAVRAVAAPRRGGYTYVYVCVLVCVYVLVCM